MPRKRNNSEENIENQAKEDQQELDSKFEIQNEDVEIVKKEEKAIIVRAKKGLSLGQFELLSKMLKYEGENTEYKIILMPYSISEVEVK